MAVDRTIGPAIEKTANDDSMATQFRQLEAHRIEDNYSRFVGLMKLVLPAAAGILILMIVVWPHFDGKPDGFRLRPSNALLQTTSGQMLINARYTGTDRRDNPFPITAKALEQQSKDDETVALHGPTADIFLNAGSWVAVMAPIGSYSKKAQLLKLSGGVDLFHDDGYEFHTEVAMVDLVDGVASSDRPVHGQGPFGQLQASGFQILDGGDRIRFQGRARLEIYTVADEEKP